MIDLVTHYLLGDLSIESLLLFLRSPRYYEVYNGLIITLLAAIGLALSLGCIRLTQHLTNQSAPNTRKLFAQLCRAHYLSSSQRQELELLADLLGLSTPALLMIDASLWQLDELTRQNKLLAKDCERLLTLQKALYDQPRLTAAS